MKTKKLKKGCFEVEADVDVDEEEKKQARKKTESM